MLHDLWGGFGVQESTEDPRAEIRASMMRTRPSHLVASLDTGQYGQRISGIYLVSRTRNPLEHYKAPHGFDNPRLQLPSQR